MIIFSISLEIITVGTLKLTRKTEVETEVGTVKLERWSVFVNEVIPSFKSQATYPPSIIARQTASMT